MDQDLTNYYKLTLSHDLIIFLMNILTDGAGSKDLKAKRTNLILEAWEKRVNINLEVMAEENIKEISQETVDEADVLRIIQKIHTAEPLSIRKEFKREVRGSVFKSYDSVKK